MPLPVTPGRPRWSWARCRISGCVFRNAEEVEALEEERLGLGWGPEVVAWCLDGEDRRARPAPRLAATIEELGGPTTEVDLVSALPSHPPIVRTGASTSR